MEGGDSMTLSANRSKGPTNVVEDTELVGTGDGSGLYIDSSAGNGQTIDAVILVLHIPLVQ
jgi:hypothetical protein